MWATGLQFASTDMRHAKDPSTRRWGHAFCPQRLILANKPIHGCLLDLADSFPGWRKIHSSSHTAVREIGGKYWWTRSQSPQLHSPQSIVLNLVWPVLAGYIQRTNLLGTSDGGGTHLTPRIVELFSGSCCFFDSFLKPPNACKHVYAI